MLLFCKPLSAELEESAVSNYEAGAFANKWYEINMNYDATVWEKSQELLAQNQLLLLKHLQSSATYSIFAYTYAEESNLEEFVSRRVAQSYDGWKSLGQRNANQQELAALNLSEGYLSIYTSKTDQAGPLKDLLVIEYYFKISDKKYFVISLQTQKSEVNQIKQVFKDLVLNTWVGEQKLNPRTELKYYPEEWRMKGQGLGNQRAIQRHYEMPLKLKVNWQKSIEDSQNPLIEVLSTKSNILIQRENGIEARSLNNASLKWKRNFDQIRGLISFDDTSVYVRVEEGTFSRKEKLLKLNLLTGKTQKSSTLSSPATLDPIIMGYHAYFVQGKTIKSLTIESNKQDWTYEIENSDPLQMLLNENKLVLVFSNSILVLNRLTGQKLFQVSLEDPIYKQAILQDEKLYFIQNHLDNKKLKFSAYDLTSQNIVWQQVVFFADKHEWIDLSCIGQQLILITQADEGQLFFKLFDTATGGLIERQLADKRSFINLVKVLRLKDRYLVVELSDKITIDSLGLLNFKDKQSFKIDNTQGFKKNAWLRPSKAGYVLVSQDEALKVLSFNLTEKK